jgi:5-methylcytosine-specific restriction endonuclease McrA
MPIDYKRYPPNWKTEIRPAILERANNRCEFCGVGNYSIRDGKKIVLTIAHLDHDEENRNVSYHRLRALCQRCHLRYDAKEKARRRNKDIKQSEHFET